MPGLGEGTCTVEGPSRPVAGGGAHGRGRRSDGEAAVRRLVFIRRCRDFGFSLEQVRELVGLIDHPERACTEARDIAAGHLAALRARLTRPGSLEARLAASAGSCDTSDLRRPGTAGRPGQAGAPGACRAPDAG